MHSPVHPNPLRGAVTPVDVRAASSPSPYSSGPSPMALKRPEFIAPDAMFIAPQLADPPAPGARRCCDYKKLFLRPDDDKRDAALKTFLFWYMLGLFVVSLFLLLALNDQVMESLLLMMCSGVILVAIATIAVALARDGIGDTMLSVLSIEGAVVFFLSEVSTVSRVGYPSYWPLFLITMSYNVVFRVPKYAQIITFFIACSSICLSTLQQIYALDVDPLRNRTDFVLPLCDCDEPPCAVPPTNAFVMILIFVSVMYLVNYNLTGFAARVDAKRAKLEAAIDIAQSIATCLSAFDLAAAEALLANTKGPHAQNIPPQLEQALEHILANLKLYRPYLPDELFSDDSPREQDLPSWNPEGIIPGCMTKEAAIVFTDIRQSTALWEHSVDNAMQDALNLHNRIIRTALVAVNGYEVKTIGDAFMVALNAADDAVRFGVAVQQNLAQAAWPAGLRRPQAEDDGFALLSVRIGVHVGPVNLERNTLTGRFDYFGPTVNAAARVEAHGIPGAVTVTAEVWRRAALGEAVVAVPFAEARYGKGLAEALWLTAVVSREAAPATIARVQALCAAVLQASVAPLTSHGSKQSDSATFDLALCDPLDRPPSLWSRTVRAAATVGVVKFAFWHHDKAEWGAVEETLARRLQELHTHLKETGGAVSTLLHNVVLVSWGVYGRCAQHMNESVRFLMLLEDGYGDGQRSPAGGCAFHAGLATGPVASGQVAAASSQRLLTILGPAVDVALLLCGGAAEAGAAVLVGSVADVAMDRFEESTLLREHLRAVDEWGVHPQRRVMVYELLLGSLRVAARPTGRRGRNIARTKSNISTRTVMSGVSTVDDRRDVDRAPGHPLHLQHALSRWVVCDIFDESERSTLDRVSHPPSVSVPSLTRASSRLPEALKLSVFDHDIMGPEATAERAGIPSE